MIDVQALVNKHYDELVALRRYFHENPELSNVEDETCEYIQKKLEEYGLRTEVVPHGGVLVLSKTDRAKQYSCEPILTPCPSRKQTPT